MRKHFFFIILISLFFVTSCIYYVQPPYEEEPPPEGEYYYEEEYEEPWPELDVSYFYDYLSPYGMWIYYSPYGYVWTPRNMAYGWRPYTRGQWVWTDYGWTWRSNIMWGWAPFHYGRWGWDRDLGWFWVPGTLWAPAWVTWRSSHLYIGWAPLPPEAQFVPGVGIRRLTFSIPVLHWVFVDGNYFISPSLQVYIFPYERNLTIINSTVHKTNIYVRNNRIVNEGIDIDQIRKITKQKIVKHELRATENPELRRIDSGILEVYRPKVKKSKIAKPKTAVEKEEALERVSKAKIIRKEETEKEQEREITLLKRSQQKELDEMEKIYEEEKESVKSIEEKEKLEKKHEEKIIKLKKSHEEEKKKIIERHGKEAEKVKKKEKESKVIKKKEKK